MKHQLRRFLVILLLSGLALHGLTSAQEQSDSLFAVHVVQRGENLFRIALQYNLFAEQVAAANGITDSNSIVVGQRLIIPLVTAGLDQRLSHVVAAGETLASIAAAYSKSEAELISLNNLASADAIYIGQELIIVAGAAEPEVTPIEFQPTATSESSGPLPVTPPSPGGGAGHSFSRGGTMVDTFVHTVRSGDTLFEIGLRYGLTVETLVSANNLLDPGLLNVGQKLIIPGIQLPRLAHDLPAVVATFTIDPLVLETGRSTRIELLTKEPVSLSGQFLGQELRVITRDEGKRHNILLGIPMFTDKAVYPLTLELRASGDSSETIAANLQVIGGGYGYQTITINDSELLAPAVEENEIALLIEHASNFTAERNWNNSLSLPAAAAMNAVFGTLRSYNGSDYDRYHRGVDFAGAPGTSVLAAAAGRVTLVDRLHIRGNTTVIDHGWGVFTLYAHQQDTLVQPGDLVTSGQVIGTIGSTGRSTGPHLHWELWLNGVNVDPMQWVQEIFP